MKNLEKTSLLHGHRVVERTRVMFRRDNAFIGYSVATDTVHTGHAERHSEFEETRPAFLAMTDERRM